MQLLILTISFLIFQSAWELIEHEAENQRARFRKIDEDFYAYLRSLPPDHPLVVGEVQRNGPLPPPRD